MQTRKFPTGRFIGHCASISLLALLAACGGGGGVDVQATSVTSSSSAGKSPADPSDPLGETVDTVIELITAPVASFETREYYREIALAMINASTGYSTGASGQGVVVAVNDGQVDTGIAELAGRIVGDNANWTGDATVSTHATHLAGTIAAARDGKGMIGVAWSASILPLTSFVTDDEGATSGYGSAPYDAIRYAADVGADIVNNSWGSTPDSAIPNALVSAVRHATDRDTIVVFSTGNAGADQPNATAMVPSVDATTRALTVAVTAVDDDGRLASYANACGDAAAWCLAAPGTRIYATDTDGDYTTMTGTSMAAAVTSGALAVVKSRFPELSAEQIVDRVLTTAKDNGIHANQALYGHGLLDLGAATRPIGTLVANAVGDNVYTDGAVAGEGTAIAGNAVIGDAVAAALGGLPVAMFDDYDGATFTVDMAGLVVLDQRPDYAGRAFGDFGRGHFADVDGLPGMRMSLSSRSRQVGAGAALSGATRDGRETVAALRLALDDRTLLFAGLNTGFAEALPANDSLPTEAGLSLLPDTMVPGALSLADGGAVLGIETALSPFTALSVAVMNEGPEETGFVGAEAFSKGASAMQASLRHDLGHGLTVEAGIGFIRESGQMLGASGTGALALGGAETVQFSVGARYAIGPDVALVARYDRAVTDAGETGAFISEARDLTSDSWTVGLLGRNGVVGGDHWGFTSHQPLRGQSGTLVLARPTGRDADGTVLGDMVTVALDGGGREIDWEAFYALPVGEQALLGFNLLYVMDPGNSATAPDEMLGMLRYRLRF
ncbi:S8 family serine peptidase [Zavarzinia compransoris]|uniref:S8 family peptidase n=1 Tax=Zavarzinia marina TaxID=2911065 RepID=UPI001F47CD0A|nr:S8 family peptidase [Zavarzinia marina]MCF4165655.1 S8 family serine peptidase [Zavarzinia marina]